MADLRNAEEPLGEEHELIARPIRSIETPSSGLSVAYVLELRRLIREDAYRSTQIADEIARRLLSSGDL